MTDPKIGYVLMNIGTPSEPTAKGVRIFLKEFLSDPDVLDINPILRWGILNLIVAPFRPRTVLPQYQSVWTDEGSPLLANSEKFKNALHAFDSELNVEIGMRYGNPSISDAVDSLINDGVEKIVICSMFPQFAQATTGSCNKKAIEIIESRGIEYSLIGNFYDEEFYIDCVVNQIKMSDAYESGDHLLFSFHGLPERQLKKLDESGEYCLLKPDCCEKESEFNQLCYKFHSTETVRRIIEKLNTEKPHTICFQSRFGRDKWVDPDILDVLQNFVDDGVENITVICPSFVADCLETLEEISIRDDEIFKEMGGGSLELVPSLNSSDDWVKGFAEFLKKNS